MIYLGIDVGSISAKVVVIGDADDRGLLESALLLEDSGIFTIPEHPVGPDGFLVASRYRRIRGKPVEVVLDILRELNRSIPSSRIGGIRTTGSGGKQISALLGTRHENEFLAIARGVGALYPRVRTVFEMGGESSKLINLEPGPDGFVGINDYSTNGDCAAGTGSFMDQQASRLG